jgi:hypothetical protein
VDAPAEERERYQAYVEQLKTAERELEQAQHRAAALRKMVEAFTELYPDLTAQGTDAPSFDAQKPTRRDVRGTTLRGKRAVEELMSGTDATLTVGEIMEQLSETGTAPASEEALRTTLNRMFKNDGKLEKDDKDGRLAYRWKR